MKARGAFRKLLFITVFAGAISLAGNSDDTLKTDQLSFAGGELLFKPLVANTYEPRMGLLTQFGKNRLRLDVGNSIDLLQYSFPGDSARITMGSDFFTYTLLRGERDFHFPVDASDYLFGINFNFGKYLRSGRLSSRLRISHISSHFVDGHYDNNIGQWKDSRAPVVYSREFLDGVIALEPSCLGDAIRGYFGASYLFHVDPKYLPRFSAETGFEFHQEIRAHVSLYISYQATALKIAEASLRHNIQFGGKLGDWRGRGLNVYLSYFSGYSIHCEYYNVKESYFALGFLLDL